MNLIQRSRRAPDVAPFHPFASPFERLFEGFLPGAAGTPNAVASFAPSVDVRSTETGYHIEAELPGVPEDAFELRVDDGVLVLHGEKSDERTADADGWRRTERRFGAFERRFTLPDDVAEDAIEARLEHGVLHVDLPRRPEATPTSRRIEVGSAG